MRFTLIGGVLRYLLCFYAIFKHFHANFRLSSVLGANFSEAKSALVLIFTLFSMSVSINIFYAYFKFEDEVPQYAKLIVFDETGMWSKVTMRGSAKGLVSHWSDRQN